MDERVLSFRVGIVVVTAVMVGFILVLLFGAVPQVLTSSYAVTVQFPRAPGVAVNTPVRKSGVNIGRVSNVRLLDEGGVLVTLRLEGDKPVRLNEFPRISTGSLVTGDAVVEFVRTQVDAQAEAQNDLLKEGDFLPNGVVANDPFEVIVNLEGKMADALTSIEEAADRASRILENLQWLGADRERFGRMLQKTELALDRFGSAMASVDTIFGDEQLQQQLRESLADLPEIIEQAKLTLEDTRKSMAGFEQVTLAATQNLENLEQFTRPLGERGERIIASVEDSAANLDALLAQLVHLTRSINERQGTLGRLVYEDDIYLRITETVANIEELTRKLQPIVNDARVFTDKIARDPSVLGVKGAIERRPTGLKAAIPLQ